MNVRDAFVDAPKLVEPLAKWSHEPARPQDATSGPDEAARPPVGHILIGDGTVHYSVSGL